MNKLKTGYSHKLRLWLMYFSTITFPFMHTQKFAIKSLSVILINMSENAAP